MTGSKAMVALGMLSVRPLEHPINGPVILEEKVIAYIHHCREFQIYLVCFKTMELIYSLEEKRRLLQNGKSKEWRKTKSSAKWTSSRVKLTSLYIQIHEKETT